MSSKRSVRRARAASFQEFANRLHAAIDAIPSRPTYTPVRGTAMPAIHAKVKRAKKWRAFQRALMIARGMLTLEPGSRGARKRSAHVTSNTVNGITRLRAHTSGDDCA